MIGVHKIEQIIRRLKPLRFMPGMQHAVGISHAAGFQVAGVFVVGRPGSDHDNAGASYQFSQWFAGRTIHRWIFDRYLKISLHFFALSIYVPVHEGTIHKPGKR
jgi:hypothetical protein